VTVVESEFAAGHGPPYFGSDVHTPAMDHRKGEVIGPQSNCSFILRHLDATLP
jgi:hypothetical protein